MGDEVIEGMMHPFVFEAEGGLQVFDEGMFYFVGLLGGAWGGMGYYSGADQQNAEVPNNRDKAAVKRIVLRAIVSRLCIELKSFFQSSKHINCIHITNI